MISKFAGDVKIGGVADQVADSHRLLGDICVLVKRVEK